MKNRGNTTGWRRLLSRASADPFFLGSALALYKSTRGIEDDELAEWLECSPEALARVILCRLPTQEERLARDVQTIADFAGCNADRLIATIREVAALGALRKEGEASREGFLMAARDRKKHSGDEGDAR